MHPIASEPATSEQQQGALAGDDTIDPRAWYAAAVIVVTLLLSVADRQVITVLVDPIRHDLGISDSQVGLLQGLGFVGLHAVATLLVGWMAERFSRRLILFGGVLFWSAMTAASGFASSFAALLSFRAGVGAGEATVVPAGYSLVGDSFPVGRRGVAMGILTTATTTGTGIAIFFVGILLTVIGTHSQPLPFIGDVRPWQLCFLMLGVIGLPVGLLTLTLREPRSKRPKATRQAAADDVSGGQAFMRHLRSHRAVMLAFFILVVCNSLAGISMTSWLPTSIIRRFGYTPADTAYLMGIVMFLGGCAALPAAAFSDRWFSSTARASRMQYHAPVFALASASSILAAFGPSPIFCALGYMICSACMCGVFAINYAVIQDLTPSSAHPRALAIVQLCVMAGGHVLGSFLPAFLNDQLFADPMKINVAMFMVSCPTYAAGGALALFVGRRYRQTQQGAEAFSAVNPTAT